jgi:hypothetical protein
MPRRRRSKRGGRYYLQGAIEPNLSTRNAVRRLRRVEATGQRRGDLPARCNAGYQSRPRMRGLFLFPGSRGSSADDRRASRRRQVSTVLRAFHSLPHAAHTMPHRPFDMQHEFHMHSAPCNPRQGTRPHARHAAWCFNRPTDGPARIAGCRHRTSKAGPPPATSAAARVEPPVTEVLIRHRNRSVPCRSDSPALASGRQRAARV